MSISFELKKLAKIENSKIEIKPFNIFFGESNTNKSYTLFAIYYFYKSLRENEKLWKLKFRKYIRDIQIEKADLKPNEIKKMIDNEDWVKVKINSRQIENIIFKEYLKNIKNFFYYLIGYRLENVNINIKNKITPEKVEFYYLLKDNYLKICSKYGKFYVSSRQITKKGIDSKLLFSAIKNYISYFDINLKKIYLFPPSRTSIIDMQKALLNISSYDIALPGLVKEFLKTYLPDLTPSFPIEDNFEDKTLKNLLIDIFGGEVEHDTSSNETFYKEKNLKIPITATASSIRELAPLYLTLRYNPINQKIYFIEEPEAHLHPSLQRKVAFLLAYIVNKGGKVFITTHSDYLVNTLSNLVKLWFLKQKDEEKAKSIMEKFNIKDEYLLSPDKLGVYFFKKNENGKVNIKNVEINEYGISPESFLNVMNEDIELAEEILEAMD